MSQQSIARRIEKYGSEICGVVCLVGWHVNVEARIAGFIRLQMLSPLVSVSQYLGNVSEYLI
jgi:hypothetical protein